MTNTHSIVLITGASRGIGHELARQLAGRDFIVLAGVRDPSTFVAPPGQVQPLHLDVTNTSTITAAAAAIDAQYGRLDILINNAGISIENGTSPLDIDADTMRRTYETNVFGVVSVTHAMLPLLKRSAAGRIVNVSSAMGSLGEWTDPESPLVKFAPVALAYNSSKSALNAITVAYAHALDDTAIKVNSADPGYVDTDLNGHTGYRSVSEGAQSIMQLATLSGDGPTASFQSDTGPVPW